MDEETSELMDEETFKLFDRGVIPFKDKLSGRELYYKIEIKGVEKKEQEGKRKKYGGDPDYYFFLIASNKKGKNLGSSVKKFGCWTNPHSIGIEKEVGLWTYSRNNPLLYWEEGEENSSFRVMAFDKVDAILAEYLEERIPVFGRTLEYKRKEKDLNKF